MFRRSDRDNFATFVACLRAKIDNPISALDHFEVVFDHDDRVPGIDQSLKNFDEQRDVVEMQTGRRFVKDEKITGAFVFAV